MPPSGCVTTTRVRPTHDCAQGRQDVEFTATVAGQFAQHEHLHEHPTAQDFDITWTFSGGTVTFTGAVLSDLGDVGPASGDVISTIDNTFAPTGVSISSN